MAKKFHTDGHALHHDHQHSYQTNAHTHTEPSISSGISTTQQNRTTTDSGNIIRESIDYIPPEISLDDHQNSDDVCLVSFILLLSIYK
jgi:hypothetical protein